MCGLCGSVRFGGLDSGADTGVETMMGAMAHRGPDDAGVAADAQACFGFVRLAIRSPGDGRQPLVGPSGVIVVCNGEIDNHRELRAWLLARGMPVAGTADVAVIPALYHALGEAFIERLEGCFALAVWDPARGQLLLGRDRCGERPLFFAPSPGGGWSSPPNWRPWPPPRPNRARSRSRPCTAAWNAPGSWRPRRRSPVSRRSARARS